MSAQAQTYQDRIENIDEIADVHSEESIKHEFTQEELDQMREELSSNMIELDKLKTQLKEYTDSFKDKMKPLEMKNKEILQGVRFGFEEKLINARGIKDMEQGIMYWYDADGNYVGQRRLFPHERQFRLK